MSASIKTPAITPALYLPLSPAGSVSRDGSDFTLYPEVTFAVDLMACVIFSPIPDIPVFGVDVAHDRSHQEAADLRELRGPRDRRGVLNAPHCSPHDTFVADPQINLINNSRCAIP